jgi:hypothetical protein
MKKKEDHPFYCYAKKCRKTAWNTPEFMTEQDWEFLAKIASALKSKTCDLFFNLVGASHERELVKGFFYRAIGWPEGLGYCTSYAYVKATAFQMLKKHDLPKIKEALDKRS